jgi:hypothetical protein
MAGPALAVFDSGIGPGVSPRTVSVVLLTCPIGSAVTVEGRFLPTLQVQQQFYMNVI